MYDAEVLTTNWLVHDSVKRKPLGNIKLIILKLKN